MGIMDLSKAANAQKAYHATLLKSFGDVKSFVEPIAAVNATGSTSIEVIGSLANMQMRIWLGERVVKNFKLERQVLLEVLYENSIGAKVDDIDTDKFGLYLPKIMQMGAAAGKLESRLVAQILQGSGSALGYDGLALIASGHTMAGTSFDNSATAALDATAFAASEAYYASLVDDSGDPAAIMGTHLVYRPGGAASVAAATLITANLIGGGNTNTNFKKVELIENPYITSGTFWALLSLSDVEKPVQVWRRFAQPEFTAVTDPQSDAVFKRNQYEFGTKYPSIVGVGSWLHAYASTGAA